MTVYRLKLSILPNTDFYGIWFCSHLILDTRCFGPKNFNLASGGILSCWRVWTERFATICNRAYRMYRAEGDRAGRHERPIGNIEGLWMYERTVPWIDPKKKKYILVRTVLQLFLVVAHTALQYLFNFKSTFQL
jgi:hypothetical protein